MDKYFNYIMASYGVAFVSIALLTASIIWNYRAKLGTLDKLKAQGMRRRSETKSQQTQQ